MEKRRSAFLGKKRFAFLVSRFSFACLPCVVLLELPPTRNSKRETRNAKRKREVTFRPPPNEPTWILLRLEVKPQRHLNHTRVTAEDPVRPVEQSVVVRNRDQVCHSRRRLGCCLDAVD